MTEQQPAPWVCPWDICNHDQAQECRAELNWKKGCGGRFAKVTTPDEAKQIIRAPWRPRGVGAVDRARAALNERDHAAQLSAAGAPSVADSIECWKCCNGTGRLGADGLPLRADGVALPDGSQPK